MAHVLLWKRLRAGVSGHEAYVEGKSGRLNKVDQDGRGSDDEEAWVEKYLGAPWVTYWDAWSACGRLGTHHLLGIGAMHTEWRTVVDDMGTAHGWLGPQVAPYKVPLPELHVVEYAERRVACDVTYGMGVTPFGGRAIIAWIENDVICWLYLLGDLRSEAQMIDRLKQVWSNAVLGDAPHAQVLLNTVFGTPGMLLPPRKESSATVKNGASEGRSRVRIVLRGTPFEKQVWSALLCIPHGAVVAYGAVAAVIGRPTAVRAVASAIGRNPISVLVPCHRVVSATGAIHKYFCGPHWKRALLAWEGAHRAANDHASPPR